ncbi:helix-turn-helix transcriptional regulator [Streptomyces scabiei]|uniref:helix-turn-helix domain-containing protein n=1 Tax=Streptomyces scabiei TaxID=1930 RepID=UPI001B315379|nr:MULTISPECIES: helix-turn-helix transcriptional regulator [Streptomyces]MDX3121602.1 helix-turn-helix transcriptional regulator [Streptomyces scabiei]MDX3520406.1 helix-turn-helix transcriptional regulator [Streptomyces scabiei]QTU46831.1 helix-turn-helix transcriptional regulator [Streptomyces sp. LBUM 1482]
MSARHFDRHRVRTVRRAAEISQAEVAAAVGVADSTIAGWESGDTVPDAEKLPALARALKRGLDDMFPRTGLPDLTDLRCDAGYYQYETAALIGTKSAGPVAGAERGERRLKDKYVPALAAAYRVSEEELRRAEDRSIAKTQETQAGQSAEDGGTVPVSSGPPGTLGEKITLILERSYPGQQGPPTDPEIADAVNAHAGSKVITGEGVRDLRTGVAETASPVVLEGLAAFFGVSPMYFQPDDAVARQVYEGLRLLSASRSGAVGRVRGRGTGSQGLPANVMEFVNDLVTELEQREPEANE